MVQSSLVEKGRNDLGAAVPKLCLALEQHRRTPEGRVRSSQEFLASFFPHDGRTCTDRVFYHLPNEVRGPIVAAWGIRGIKSALRDDHEKMRGVVHDALVAGDIDHGVFEEALTPETLVRWLPLADLWAFWRGGKLTKQAIHKALCTAYELYLFDARWFLETVQAKGGSLKGTDVLADGLTKDELTAWIRRVHETADGTAKGLIAALGWDKIVARTSGEVLVATLDAIVAKAGLGAAAPEPKAARAADDTGPQARATGEEIPAFEVDVPATDRPTDSHMRAAAPVDDAAAETKSQPPARSERPPAKSTRR